jgi:hypothetical protein
VAARAHAHGGGSIEACPRGVRAALCGGDLIVEWPKVDRGRRGFSPEAGRGGEQLLDGLRWQLPSSEHGRWRAAVLELLRPRRGARQLQGLQRYTLDHTVGSGWLQGNSATSAARGVDDSTIWLPKAAIG